MANEKLEIDIVLDDGKVVKGFAAIENAADKAGKKAQSAFGDSLDKSISGSLGKLRNTLLGLGTALAGAFTLKAAVNEAVKMEDAVNSLQASFRAAGIPVAQASAQFQSFAQAMENATAYGADLIIQNSAVLVSIGKLRGEGLEKATTAATNLAAGLNMDLGTAFDLVAKAAAGNTGVLSRYGIQIDKTVPQSEKFAVALQKIEAAFGGMAESRVNTFSGAMALLGHAFEGVLEELGNLVIKSPVVIALIKDMSGRFIQLSESVKGVGSSGDVIGNLVKQTLIFGQTLVTYVLAPMEQLYNFGNFLFRTFLVLTQSVIVAFAEIGNALTNVVIVPIQKVLEGASKVAAYFDKDLAKAMGGWAVSLQSLPDTTATAVEASSEVLTKFTEDLVESNDKLFDFSVSDSTSNLISQLQEVAANAKPVAEAAGAGLRQAFDDGLNQTVTVGGAFAATLDGLTEKMSEFAKTGVTNFKTIGASMMQSLGGAAGQAFAAFGKAVATGKNALGAFLDSLLASFGQMAIQLGTQFMLQGAAYMWAGMPNGGALIAAGAALAAFGGVLSGLGGAKETGGGVATAGGTSTVGNNETALPAVEPVRAGPQVNVNIQGNVLDRRDTGMWIVDHIREQFDAYDNKAFA